MQTHTKPYPENKPDWEVKFGLLYDKITTATHCARLIGITPTEIYSLTASASLLAIAIWQTTQIKLNLWLTAPKGAKPVN